MLLKYYSCSDSVMLIDKSSSCFASTTSGALVRRHVASFTLGKAITSLIESLFAISITSLSRPYASPACGGTPYLNASSKKPNFSLATSPAKNVT